MIKSGYFNSVKMSDGTYDRLYTAEQLNTFLQGLISETGIFLNVLNMFAVESSTGIQVLINSDKAQINFHWVSNDSKEPLVITNSHVTLNRYSAVVLRLNEQDRNVELLSIDGEPAVEPVKPAMIREDGIYDICIAYIYIPSGATEIKNDMIEDAGGYSDVCGFIQGLIEQIETTTLFKQWQDANEKFYDRNEKEFKEWFKELTDELNVATYIERNTYNYINNTSEVKQFKLSEIFDYYDTDNDKLELYVSGLKVCDEDLNYVNIDDNIYLEYNFKYPKQEIEIVLWQSRIGYNTHRV